MCSFSRIILLLLLAGAGCGKPSDPAQEKRRVEAERVHPSPGGTVSGRVVLDGVAPPAQKLLVIKDVAVCGVRQPIDERLLVGEGHGIRNAVISINGIPKGLKRGDGAREHKLDQTGCVYSPHVLILPVNTPLKILNEDGILHNIHTYSTVNRAVNIAQPPARKVLEMTFSEPERISFRCDVHGWMSSWVVVVDHPFHAVSGEDGSFSIDNVPPGSYTIECWHELLGTQTVGITISNEVPAEPVMFRFEPAR